MILRSRGFGKKPYNRLCVTILNSTRFNAANIFETNFKTIDDIARLGSGRCH